MSLDIINLTLGFVLYVEIWIPSNIRNFEREEVFTPFRFFIGSKLILGDPVFHCSSLLIRSYRNQVTNFNIIVGLVASSPFHVDFLSF